MANPTWVKFLPQAEATKEFANEVKALLAKSRRLTKHHFANGFSTAADATKPEWLLEDESNNIKGLDYTRQHYQSMMYLADQLEKFLTGQATDIGNYADNVEKVSDV